MGACVAGHRALVAGHRALMAGHGGMCDLAQGLNGWAQGLGGWAQGLGGWACARRRAAKASHHRHMLLLPPHAAAATPRGCSRRALQAQLLSWRACRPAYRPACEVVVCANGRATDCKPQTSSHGALPVSGVQGNHLLGQSRALPLAVSVASLVESSRTPWHPKGHAGAVLGCWGSGRLGVGGAHGLGEARRARRAGPWGGGCTLPNSSLQS